MTFSDVPTFAVLMGVATGILALALAVEWVTEKAIVAFVRWYQRRALHRLVRECWW